ncbi:MAG: hypothetical protein AAF700_03350 [Pseudomonadota bacterium]
MSYFNLPSALTATLIAAGATLPYAAQAQAQALLTYDDLSFVEEGLATDLGGAVLSFQGLLDQRYLVEPDDAAERSRSLAQARLRLEGELANGWTLGAEYLGIFTYQGTGVSQHRFAVFTGGGWGQLSFGDVTAKLENAVSRGHGVGNASLAFSRGFGGLSLTGAHYMQTINAYQIHVAVDEYENAQVGLVYEAPVAAGAWTWGARAGTGLLQERSAGIGFGDTRELAAFAGYTRGAFSVGAELGTQDITLDGAAASQSQDFASIGLKYKAGRSSFSMELGHAEFNAVDYEAVALGYRYDIARGLSVNVGANYLDNDVDSTWTVPLSIRYEF